MAEATENTRKRSQVADVDRSLYDFKMSEEGYERYADGLSTDIVRAISEKKDEPEWMLEMRLKALAIYEEMEMPANWGPSIEMLDLNHISAYVSPKTKQANSWDDVPEDIKNTFERLGIPEAERESLAGVGAQYDSEIVYHNMREEVAPTRASSTPPSRTPCTTPSSSPSCTSTLASSSPCATTSLPRCTTPCGVAARLCTCPRASRSPIRCRATSA